MSPDTTTAEGVREARRALGLSRTEAAAWLDVGARYLENIENGSKAVPHRVALPLELALQIDAMGRRARGLPRRTG